MRLVISLFASTILLSAQIPEWQRYLSEGIAAMKEGQIDSAITLLQRAANLAPNEIRPHSYLAAAYLSKFNATGETDFPSAEAEYQRVLSIDPNDNGFTKVIACSNTGQITPCQERGPCLGRRFAEAGNNY